MTPEQAAGLLQYFQQNLRQESATTARVLAAVPDDKCDYTPADKCMTAQKLTGHIAFVDMWFLESVVKGKFESEDDSALTAMKPSEVAATYKEKMPALIDSLSTLSGEQLAKEIEFYSWKLPAVVYVDFCLRHMIHHRGQLSAYLRPMGAKVPSIYGGSADEPFESSANA
jgi:uncharacterized damage-inducible protein DinB